MYIAHIYFSAKMIRVKHITQPCVQEISESRPEGVINEALQQIATADVIVLNKVKKKYRKIFLCQKNIAEQKTKKY